MQYVIKHTPSDQYVYQEKHGMVIFTNTKLLAEKFPSFEEADSRFKTQEYQIEEWKSSTL